MANTPMYASTCLESSQTSSKPSFVYIKRNSEHLPKPLINNVHDVPLSQLPHHYLKWFNVSIKISRRNTKSTFMDEKSIFTGTSFSPKAINTYIFIFMRVTLLSSSSSKKKNIAKLWNPIGAWQWISYEHVIKWNLT